MTEDSLAACRYCGKCDRRGNFGPWVKFHTRRERKEIRGQGYNKSQVESSSRSAYRASHINDG
jgi:hypothetical protein